MDIFHTWPENEEVQFVWQAALTETAAFLDQESGIDQAAVGGWSPATLDPATMLLSMRRRDLRLRYFGSDSMVDPVSTLIIPQALQRAAHGSHARPFVSLRRHWKRS